MNLLKIIDVDNIKDIKNYEYVGYEDKIKEWKNILKIKGFSKKNIAALSDKEVENLLYEVDTKDTSK